MINSIKENRFLYRKTNKTEMGIHMNYKNKGFAFAVAHTEKLLKERVLVLINKSDLSREELKVDKDDFEINSAQSLWLNKAQITYRHHNKLKSLNIEDFIEINGIRTNDFLL